MPIIDLAVLVVEANDQEVYFLQRATCIARQMAKILGLTGSPTDLKTIRNPSIISSRFLPLDWVALEMAYRSNKVPGMPREDWENWMSTIDLGDYSTITRHEK